MANNCSNYLAIKGDAEDITRIKEALVGVDTDGNDICFQPNNLVPRYDEKGIHLDYDAFGNHLGTSIAKEWGTRYMEDASIVTESSTYITYSFESAWAPPIEWLVQVATMYPTLEFELDYEEPGNGVYGRAKGANGDVVDEEWDKEQFLEETSDLYPSLVKQVQGMSQEDLIKAFSSIEAISDCYDETEEWPEFLNDEHYEWNLLDMFDFEVLTKHIIDAIEFKNLPLFISVDWDSYQDRFNERISKGE